MFRCFVCHQPVPLDDQEVGSRCPRCRQPLYEDPRESRAMPAQAQGSRCTVHETNAAVAACQRCGNFMCPVCRTRWRGQAVCLACVQRALESKEQVPAEARAHLRQAILSVLLGGVAWVLGLASLAMVVASMEETNLVLAGLGVLAMLATPFPALMGIGQAAAAIRARGDHMILATIGLFLSGLHTGVFLGMLTLALFQN
jgi:hypothetical protein